MAKYLGLPGSPRSRARRSGKKGRDFVGFLQDGFSTGRRDGIDALSFTVMRRLGIGAALAFNVHFKQHGRFRVLP